MERKFFIKGPTGAYQTFLYLFIINKILETVDKFDI